MCVAFAFGWLTMFSTQASATSYDPSEVRNTAVTPGDGTLAISWVAPADPGLSLFSGSYGQQAYIRWYTVKLSAYGNPVCQGGETSCTISGLTNGQSYTIYIQACNSNNDGALFSYCLWDSVVTISGTPCCGVPTAPPSISATVGDAAATVQWQAPTVNPSAIGPITKYVISRSPGGVVCETAELTCQVGGLANGTAYAFTVVAVNARGSSPPSAPSIQVVPAGLPTPARNVTATLAKGTAVISWDAPENSNGAPIDTYRASGAPGDAGCETQGELSCVIKGLSNGTVYSFTVIAFNRVGAAAPSAASPPARLAAVPTAVVQPRASLKGNGAFVQWTAPRSTGGIKITKYVVTTIPGGQLCTTRKTSCTVSGLRLGSTYRFSIQPFNSKGAGIPATSNAITVPKLAQTIS
jgi:hypothetical protein